MHAASTCSDFQRSRFDSVSLCLEEQAFHSRRQGLTRGRIMHCSRRRVFFLGLFAVFAAHVQTCPLELHPPKVVVRFGDPVTVNCTASEDHEGIGWEAKDGDVEKTQRVKFLIWSVESLKRWEIYPQCYANFERDQCSKRLSVTVYKTPDSVSIRFLDQAGPVKEGSDYQMECEVQNIAPVQNLTVKWYKGNAVVNETTYPDKTLTPVKVSSILLITPSRGDDGVQYRCVAELDLGPDGPQPPLIVTSEPLNITVHYPPLLEPDQVVGVPYRGEGSLVCSAEGNPPPQLRWNYTAAGNVIVTTRGRNSTAHITEASYANSGVYTCTATNYLGIATKTFNVTVATNTEDDQTVFWAVIGTGVVVAVLLICGYVLLKFIFRENSII